MEEKERLKDLLSKHLDRYDGDEKIKLVCIDGIETLLGANPDLEEKVEDLWKDISESWADDEFDDIEPFNLRSYAESSLLFDQEMWAWHEVLENLIDEAQTLPTSLFKRFQ